MENVPQVGFVNIFLTMRPRLEDLRDKVPFSSHHVKGTCHQRTQSLLLLTVIPQAQVVFVRFLQVTLCPTFHTVLLGRKPLHAANIYGVGSYAPSPCRQCVHINYLGFSCTKGFISSSLLIYLFSHFFISVWMHGYRHSSFFKMQISPHGETREAAKHLHKQNAWGLLSSTSAECVKSSLQQGTWHRERGIAPCNLKWLTH